jgi:hypothetical protein
LQIWFWIVLGVAFKIPVAALCWICWKAITDQPDQVLGDADGGTGVPVAPGPRLRDPHTGSPRTNKSRRRKDPGHAPADRPVAALPPPALPGARRGD